MKLGFTNSLKIKSLIERFNLVFSHSLKILSFIISFIGGNTSAQNLISGKQHVDFGVEYFSSGNGHGAFVSPTIILNKKYNSISVSPMIQKSSVQLGGLKVAYVRNLTGAMKFEFDDLDSLDAHDLLYIQDYKDYHHNHKDVFQINVYSYFQFNKPLSLSSRAAYTEQITHAKDDINWGEVKLSTIESGAGFELQVNFTNSVSFKTYVGAGVYHHYNCGYKLYNGNTAMSLNLGMALFITLDKLTKN